MRYIKIFVLLAFLSLVLVHCSKDTPLETNTNPPPSAPDLSKLSEIQSRVFTPSCALSGCHAGSNPRNNLNLEAGNAWTALVNVTSVENASLKRVQPGNASQSLLIHKLTAQSTTLMPAGGPALEPALIDSIKKWINDGALNN